MKDTRTYKPELKELTKSQDEAVNKYALVGDTETGKLIVDHMKTEYINRTLFPGTAQEAMETRGVTDQYFNGYLAGLEAFYEFIHERAEMQKNASL